MTEAALSPAAAPVIFDARRLRDDFPGLHQDIHGRPLVFLDNAASSQTPQPVLDSLMKAYTQDRANIHRGVHLLSQRATVAYEDARKKLQRFIGAASEREIIFVRGTTEAINLVAQTFGRTNIGPGDEVLVTALEHHSNIVPWQMLCDEKGATLKVAAMNDAGEVTTGAFKAQLSSRTKLAAFAHVSNALGTVLPVEEMTRLAHSVGAKVLIDGAQAVPHKAVDVVALDCDFYAFSGHKMFGPTGVGVLYGKQDLLSAMPPWQGGGDMIRTVTFEGSTWADIPHKFEAGTPDITGGIAMGAAVDYIESIGIDAIGAWEEKLVDDCAERLGAMAGIRLIGTPAERAGVVSFVMDNVHPHDIGTVLDMEGVAIRTGHHCAQPVMDTFGVPATARASFAFYNTPDDVDALVAALIKVRELLG